MKCRHCRNSLSFPLVDLGVAPPSNAYLTQAKLDFPELEYPLRVLVCDNCWLAQTEDFASREELFEPDYAYFSGYSSSWRAHCERYVAQICARLRLGSESFVVELASNDGCLLQYVKAKGIDCLGIEPTQAPAKAAEAKGIPVLKDFFGASLADGLASKGREADLVVANNVLAHVPDINDFVSGIRVLLKKNGVATLEFPHLLELCRNVQFDTIYHEHYSYLSLTTVVRIFEHSGLQVFDVEPLTTHGGSLRVYAQRADFGHHSTTDSVGRILRNEAEEGLCSTAFCKQFQERADKVRDDFRQFVVKAVASGKNVGAYGAAAKGNTLLNYAGLTAEQISFVADLNENKQGKFLPGSRIPIVDEQFLKESTPDFVIILPWNLRSEIESQLNYVRGWGGKFVTAIPSLSVF